MMFFSIVLAGAGGMLLSELIGRGRVVYTRMASLFLAYAVACGIAGYVAVQRGGTLIDVLAIYLSTVPLMAAWLGFRIHLSNSITLEMAELLFDGEPRTVAEIDALYDVDAHTKTRVDVLKAGGYLSADADERLIDTPRSRVVLAMIRVLCGDEGPRAVAAFLKNRVP
jgi:hypothetical protein